MKCITVGCDNQGDPANGRTLGSIYGYKGQPGSTCGGYFCGTCHADVEALKAEHPDDPILGLMEWLKTHDWECNVAWLADGTERVLT